MAEKPAIAAALQANKDHQYALKAYTERLEAELRTVDKMIAAIDSDDDTEDVADTGLIYVDGAVKPESVVLPRALLSEDSPFYEDAQWRKRYDEYTTTNQMKAKEHGALREAVRIENMRMFALDAQSRNQPVDIKSFPPEHFEQNTEGIDWRRVSAQMSSSIPNAIPRTPKECEIRWLGHLHPSINKSPWTPQETERLRSILAELGTENPSIDWVDISKKLGTSRTPIDCMRHGMTRRSHTWTLQADSRLLEAVELYGQNNWQLVAMNVSEDVTAHQCQKRYLDSLDPSLKSGPWSSEEDEKLRRAITAFAGPHAVSDSNGETEGTSSSRKHGMIPWQEVALFVPGRTNNQCREHYQDSIMKSKGKGKGRSGRRYAKEREKEKDVVGDHRDDDGPESDTTGEVERIAAPSIGECETRLPLEKNEQDRARDRGNSDQNVSSVNEEPVSSSPDNQTAENGTDDGESQISHTEESTLQPRPERKADSVIETMDVEREQESSIVQPRPTIVQDDAPPSPDRPTATTPHDTSDTMTRQGPKIMDVHTPKDTLTKPSKKRKAAVTLFHTKDAEPPNSEIIDDGNSEQIASTSTPTSKKRKPVGRPRKNAGMGPPIHEPISVLLQAPDESGPSDGTHVSVGLEPAESNTPIRRRRSLRLARAKS